MTPPKQSHPPLSKRLFAEPEHSGEVYIANVDGAARGNPGPASYGVVIRKPDGTVLESLGKRLGHQTNNVAEYHALIAALDFAEAHGIRRMRIRSDSLLLVQQMKGIYKVKNPGLKPLHERASRMTRALEFFAIEHVPRERNAEADTLANAALDGPVSGAAAVKSAPAAAPAPASGASRAIRARFSRGALHPAEPLALAEGDEVEITLRKL